MKLTDTHKRIYDGIGTSLEYLSNSINAWVQDYYFDEKDDVVKIILKKGVDRALFCSLLCAGGHIHPNDECLSIEFAK